MKWNIVSFDKFVFKNVDIESNKTRVTLHEQIKFKTANHIGPYKTYFRSDHCDVNITYDEKAMSNIFKWRQIIDCSDKHFVQIQDFQNLPRKQRA